MSSEIEGVSIVICSYNGAQRLTPTFSHLAVQRVDHNIPWEIILIDNASTDGTSEVAHKAWSATTETNFRVIQEERPGLSHARRRGFLEAQYEYVSFIDDDNWVDPNWVNTVYKIMQEHPEVGACGGRTTPVFEIEPPEGFHSFYDNLAIGQQASGEGDVTKTRGWLWGAGLTVRKKAWEQITRLRWQSLLEDRKGKVLTSGGDNEICYWLRLLGWRIYYSPDLVLEHFIPSYRTEPTYIRRLLRSGSLSDLLIQAYRRLFSNRYGLSRRSIPRLWVSDIRRSIKKLFQAIFYQSESVTESTLYNRRVHALEYHWSSILDLLRLGPWGYQHIYKTILGYSEDSGQFHHNG